VDQIPKLSRAIGLFARMMGGNAARQFAVKPLHEAAA
jgi:hypothetical protein